MTDKIVNDKLTSHIPVGDTRLRVAYIHASEVIIGHEGCT
jgi:hypothetical protein